jgi:acyl-CoA thioester hydrolase
LKFERTLHVAWAHLDANGHMANTAYLDIVVDVRFMYFAERGFPPAEFHRLGIGPVVRRDEVDYYRELRLMQRIHIDMQIAGISDDVSRFKLRHEIRREDGELAARVTTLAGIFDLKSRKLIAPPEGLAEALRALDRSEDFEPLESSVNRGRSPIS